MSYLAIRFKVGLKQERTKRGSLQNVADHPFSREPQPEALKRVLAGYDWSNYVDVFGLGVQYDAVCGHLERDDYSPEVGVQWACTVVPEEFAIAAAAAYPSDVELIDPDEWEAFYETRHAVNNADEELDTEALQGHLARLQLEKEIAGAASAESLARAQAALDPMSDARGVHSRAPRTARALLDKRNLAWEKIGKGRDVARARGLGRLK